MNDAVNMPMPRSGQQYRSNRLKVLIGVVLFIGILGFVIHFAPSGSEGSSQSAPLQPPIQTIPAQVGFPPAGFSEQGTKPTEKLDTAPSNVASLQAPSALDDKEAAFSQLRKARSHLDKKEFDKAILILQGLIRKYPDFAEAHVNLGYARLGQGKAAEAHDALMHAIDLQPGMANAYFGLGIAFEALGDLEMAMGAMRSFLHLTNTKDPYNPNVISARSALWEWESQLGRGPWGPTKGIPPGLTQEDVRRDGKGIGMLMPQPDGTSRSQERPSDHFPKNQRSSAP